MGAQGERGLSRGRPHQLRRPVPDRETHERRRHAAAARILRGQPHAPASGLDARCLPAGLHGGPGRGACGAGRSRIAGDRILAEQMGRRASGAAGTGVRPAGHGAPRRSRRRAQPYRSLAGTTTSSGSRCGDSRSSAATRRTLPGSPAVDLLPVDHVARAVVRLSEDKADNENWHLFHPHGLAWAEILRVIRAEGYVVRPVPHAEWMAALERRVEADGQERGLGPLVPLMREGAMRLGDISFDNQKSRRALADVGCPLPPADTKWVQHMFEYFRVAGVVPSASRAPLEEQDA